MLYGVSIGPGDPELLTLKALKIIKEADEVIAPGKLAARVIENIRKPRIVEFPMGKSEKVVEELSKELAERSLKEKIAFIALGDVMFYSTFIHVAKKVVELGGKIECIPGVASFSCAFDVSKIFCDKTFGVVTAKDLESVKSNLYYLVVLKATKPTKVEKIAEKLGYRVKAVVRRMFMENEEVLTGRVPEIEDYFTVVILEKL
jgi:precorrin-2/cobalt-factor-2 C20-methyltransferase